MFAQTQRWIYGPKHVQRTLLIKPMYLLRWIPYCHYNYTVKSNIWNKQSSYLYSSPQSVRFCRPLKIEFIKERTVLILKEKTNLDVTIKNLRTYSYTSINQIIVVKYESYMTLIDGKILNVITGTKNKMKAVIPTTEILQDERSRTAKYFRLF